MRVCHSFNKRVEKEVEKNPGFMLTNGSGGFFSLGLKANFTKYNGLVTLEDEHFKTIESLNPKNETESALTNEFYRIIRDGGESEEKFYMDQNTLLYGVDDYKGRVEVVLDCRNLYDFHDMGRIYNIREEGDCILVEYIKYRSEALHEEDYRIYLAIKGADYEKVDEWLPRDYEYDMQRENNPATQFVYHALNLLIDGSTTICFSASRDKNKALEMAQEAYEKRDYIKKSLETHVTTAIHPEFHINKKSTEIAYVCAKNSLYSLLTEAEGTRGIYAGLPWFHQFWARDECISAGALIEEENYKLAKEILFRLLDNIQNDGRIINRWPATGLGSADGVGWMFKRIYDLLHALDEKNLLKRYLNDKDIAYIKDKLKFSVENLLNEHTCGGLAYNDAKETWMDTSSGNDTRSGYRIEIQALRLNMYRLMRQLCILTGNRKKYDRYRELEEVTAKKVRESFFEGYLYDGVDDSTIRPNVFLAYYVYPWLLSRREWQNCFDKVIPSLWLDWGGFSTIDKASPLFTPEYTGENDTSYHRGDSWLFVNNIAAMCLHRVNKRKYSKYIEKILQASEEDVLYEGIIGHCSELSSAKQQRAEGSPVQAWSAATLIDLIHLLHSRSY